MSFISGYQDNNDFIIKTFIYTCFYYFHRKNKLNSYLMQISKPLGRGEHKERFLYFYRYEVNNSIRVKTQYSIFNWQCLSWYLKFHKCPLKKYL